jgi:glycosyltransferase involved in cell wall biosynthesis
VIIIHGPWEGKTGLGYVIQGLYKGLVDLGIPCAASDAPDLWRAEGYHLVIDQPIQIDPHAPWHGAIPFFELPLRSDEWDRLKASADMRRQIFCANPFIHDQVTQINLPENYDSICMVQMGADPVETMTRERERAIITVGKAEPRKGTSILLKALQVLRDSNTEFEAHLSITHPLHTQLEIERLQEYADQYQFSLLPFHPDKMHIDQLFAACPVAVFPSCAEGWNLGLTEALAQGCTVVASDIPAHRYQFNILVKGIGIEEAEQRMLLVPTKELPMKGHQRWYPAHLYPGVTWQECCPMDLAETLDRALNMTRPDPLPLEHPLSWKAAAEVLLSHIERVYPAARGE